VTRWHCYLRGSRKDAVSLRPRLGARPGEQPFGLLLCPRPDLTRLGVRSGQQLGTRDFGSSGLFLDLFCAAQGGSDSFRERFVIQQIGWPSFSAPKHRVHRPRGPEKAAGTCVNKP
jgi:hypothetical protein